MFFVHVIFKNIYLFKSPPSLWPTPTEKNHQSRVGRSKNPGQAKTPFFIRCYIRVRCWWYGVAGECSENINGRQWRRRNRKLICHCPVSFQGGGYISWRFFKAAIIVSTPKKIFRRVYRTMYIVIIFKKANLRRP